MKTNSKEFKKLIDEAGNLDEQIKKLSKQFDKIKIELKEIIELENITETIVYLGEKYSDKVVPSEKRKDADPEETFNFLTKIGKEEKFIDIVKVSAKGLENIIGKEDSNKLRPVTESIINQSFSKVE